LRKGFTLIELIVVAAILTVMIGLLLSAAQRVREAGNRITCQNNLKQLALAALHHEALKGKFPTGVHISDTKGTTWESELLPFVDQSNLQTALVEIDPDEDAAAGTSAPTAQVIKLLNCPSDPLPKPVDHCPACGELYAVGSYGGNAGRRFLAGDKATRDGIFFPDSKIRVQEVSDGASNTLFFGERSHRDEDYDPAALQYAPVEYYPLRGLGKWANFCFPAHHFLSSAVPINYQMPPGSSTSADHVTKGSPSAADHVKERIDAFGSGHPGGANFALVDGSVRFLSDQIPLTTLQALSTRAGGEVAEEP
jgi:prepilin-type N-terminal cleavage/methylation domain-containing protein/prepilin-type processing-associated H-X9-DG protein